MPQTDDIVERLRRKKRCLPPQGGGSISTDGQVTSYVTDDGMRLVNPDGPEAADEIERLREENARIAARILMILGGERDGMSKPAIEAFQSLAKSLPAPPSVEGGDRLRSGRGHEA